MLLGGRYIRFVTFRLILLRYFFVAYMIPILFTGLLSLTFLVCRSHPSLFYLVLVECISVQLYGELVMNPTNWHQVRGSIMIVVMKAISFAWDSRNSLVSSVNNSAVSALQQNAGYMTALWAAYALCPPSVIFGPWFSFSSFERLHHYPDMLTSTKKSSSVLQIIRFISRVGGSFLCAFCCLVSSTCITYFLLFYFNDNRWMNAYFSSQSFRFSHYFVSYTSTSLMAAFGFGFFPPESRSELHSKDAAAFLPIRVTRMFDVEFPRSLVDVVISWNIPMHIWLKRYVYKPIRPFGHGLAILGTYTVSSLLHGLNFQLSAVLLSIGAFAYIEHILRIELARIFDACIASRPCPPNCGHNNKDHFWVSCCNFGFTCLAMMHLAYLAVVFDLSEEQIQGYSMRHVWEKWSNLGFFSHYVALSTYLFYVFIS